MDEKIEQVYKKFNYTTNVNKLLKTIPSSRYTAKDIKAFLDKRVAGGGVLEIRNSVLRAKVIRDTLFHLKHLTYWRWIYLLWRSIVKEIKDMVTSLL